MHLTIESIGPSEAPMAEAPSDVRIVDRLHEQGRNQALHPAARVQWLELVETILLASVALATAWSGYQAARWASLSTVQYSLASRTTVAAQVKLTLAGQDRLYDITTFNQWLAATMEGKDQLAALYQRRFRPEYAEAFAAWQKLDPFHNPAAPAGPIFMAEYRNANSRESETLSAEAESHFENGVRMRETGDDYVKVGVFLATVLLLTALGQRFKIFGTRVAVLAIAVLLLIAIASLILTYERA
jgi:hypothetical protein